MNWCIVSDQNGPDMNSKEQSDWFNVSNALPASHKDYTSRIKHCIMLLEENNQWLDDDVELLLPLGSWSFSNNSTSVRVLFLLHHSNDQFIVTSDSYKVLTLKTSSQKTSLHSTKLQFPHLLALTCSVTADTYIGTFYYNNLWVFIE